MFDENLRGVNQKDVIVPPAAGTLDVTPCGRSIFFAEKYDSIDSNSDRLSSLQTPYSTL